MPAGSPILRSRNLPQNPNAVVGPRVGGGGEEKLHAFTLHSTMSNTYHSISSIETALLKLDVSEGGEWRPLVLCADMSSKALGRIHRRLAHEFSRPTAVAAGCGKSELPDEFDSSRTCDAHLELMESWICGMPYWSGCPLGGWVATEVAVRDAPHIGIVLVASNGSEDSAIALTDRCRYLRAFLKPICGARLRPSRQGAVEHCQLVRRRLLCFARGRAAQARFGWSPNMHIPAFAPWLQQINKPPLVLLGERIALSPNETGRPFRCSHS